ncbi:hypothetical protein J6590_018124 [Homalodisca vitripennis]|nr:hypothetical protein J6590_101264 [Homalodisca vitripennis]KAG8322738.1 hypothetical protein J6590_018124 [Homalodisca vitripennis]
MSCSKCSIDLSKDSADYVTCGKCKTDIHFRCAGLSRTTWKAKSLKEKQEWECDNCRASRSGKASLGLVEEEPDDPSFLALKNFIQKMFEKQEKIITERVDRVMALIAEFEQNFKKVFDDLSSLEEKTNSMQNEIEDLRTSLECERQYNRSKNVIITSVPQIEREDVGEIVIKLLKKMDFDIKKEEFTAHRLPGKNGQAPIILQCSTRGTRDNIVRLARKIKPRLSMLSRVDQDKAIYFNDHLTPYFANMMIEAKRVKAENGFKYLWLNGNRIMMRKDHTSTAFKIEKLSDLKKITS